MGPSVSDLLAEQPEPYLRRMLDGIRSDLARLTVEAQQVEDALAKQSRRSRTGGGGSLTRQQVYNFAATAGHPVAVADVHKVVTDAGIEASLGSVRNHLARLADKDHTLTRTLDGRFALPFVPADLSDSGEEAHVPEINEDDIPF